MSTVTIKTKIALKPGLPVEVKTAYKVGKGKRFLTIEGTDGTVHMDRQEAKHFLTILESYKENCGKYCKQFREYLRTQLK